MSGKTKYVLDTKNGEASLEIFIDEELVTIYSYSNNEIVLSERNKTEIFDLETLSDIVYAIRDWVLLIRSSLLPSDFPLDVFDESKTKKSDSLDGVYRISNKKIADIKFDATTRLVTLKPRQEITIKFRNFYQWSEYLVNFFLDTRNF